VNSALVVTTIAPPNQVLQACASGCREHGLDFIVIGDTKSPPGFHLEGCDFWGVNRQSQLPYPLARLLPENHYARKNIGYLLAMARGAEVIIETDDDNLPKEGFWQKRSATAAAHLVEHAGWVNPLRHFSSEPVWPRGFPLELAAARQQDFTTTRLGEQLCPIQQGLVDGDPDLDAIFRMTRPLPTDFRDASPLALGTNSWAPFNSQNTTWFREAFPLLYLPSFCSFRMCDIWRSFVAQRICWANQWRVLFHGATVIQERNPHDLLRDFADEIPGYLHNAAICRDLAGLDILPGVKNIPAGMIRCYEAFIDRGLIGADELPLLHSWLTSISPILTVPPCRSMP
jgi:hypothetical protein